MVLDDLQKIHERDAQGLLDVVAKQRAQPVRDLELKGNGPSEVRNIVFCAMGGSALPALFVSVLGSVRVPLEVVRDYDLPSYVDSNTLCIAASFSGNTEETLTALEQAQQQGAQVAVITNGGKLQRLAEEHNYLSVLLPESFPRFSLWYGVRALFQVLEKAHVLRGDFRPSLEQAARSLETADATWGPTTATQSNMAKQLALELMGKSIVMYSGPRLSPAAYKWKLGFNENAKQLAWINQYPELNHNEFTGWSRQPVEKPYAVIELRSTLEQARIQERFELTERLLSGMRPAPLVVNVKGATLQEQLAWTTLLGDYVTVYLALLNGLDPAPLPLVDKLKRALSG